MTGPELSIVIPAYNEEKRLPATIARLVSYLNKQKISAEFIIVNDGSKDKTVAVVEQLDTQGIPLKVVSHFPNRGRGFAVRQGLAVAQGKFLLETDSDGSVADEAIGNFLAYFNKHQEVDAIFGSRNCVGAKIANQQPFLRVFLGYGFLYLAKALLGLWRITDFTLGFKMFRRQAARDIFAHQYDNHFVAEAEIIYATKKRSLVMAELPVIWTDNRDSRVRPFRDSFRSLRGILRIITNNWNGKY